MDAVFKALADPSRRALLDGLNAHGGQTLTQLCAGLSMARQSVSKHLTILEAANLITTQKVGREKLHYVNAEPINAIADRWIRQYDRARVQTLADLKTALESEAMPQTTDFVYTTYIKTTPERLWQALTDPAFSQRYLGHALVSDWRPGSTYSWQDGDLLIEREADEQGHRVARQQLVGLCVPRIGEARSRARHASQGTRPSSWSEIRPDALP